MQSELANPRQEQKLIVTKYCFGKIAGKFIFFEILSYSSYQDEASDLLNTLSKATRSLLIANAHYICRMLTQQHKDLLVFETPQYVLRFGANHPAQNERI